MPVMTDEDITRVFSGWHAQDREPIGKCCRDIFHAVDCQVNLAPEEGLLNLFDEEPFPADFRERYIENFVSRGLDSPKAHRKPGRNVSKSRLNPFSLPNGKTAAPGSHHEGCVCSSTPSHLSPLSARFMIGTWKRS